MVIIIGKKIYLKINFFTVEVEKNAKKGIEDSLPQDSLGPLKGGHGY